MNESHSEYYHLSDRDYGAKIGFTPRDPNMYGESTLPRISVATTVEGALVALGSVLYGALHIYIYQVTGDPEIIPADKSVKDRKITGEYWVLEPTVFEKVGRVPMQDIPDDLLDQLQNMGVGPVTAIPEQTEVKAKLKPYVSLMAGVAEAMDEEEDENIRFVPAPMNFDRSRAKNKQ